MVKEGLHKRFLYNAFDIIEVKTNEKPMEVFEKALENVMPLLELKVRRVGGAKTTRSRWKYPLKTSDSWSALDRELCSFKETRKQWSKDLLLNHGCSKRKWCIC